MSNLLVGQSGGPTAVINGSLFGVIQEAARHSQDIDGVLGMINGLEGFLQDKIYEFTKDKWESFSLLKTTPGAFLGSCRFKLPEDMSDEVYGELFSKFEQYEIGYILYIGGNDSMDTVSKLSQYASTIKSSVKILGVPKTIDNDLVMTDHTPGFGSAAKFVATTVREIAVDASVYDTRSVTIVEIMGRHAGWLTASSILARTPQNQNPLLVYLPESDFDQEVFLRQVEEALTQTQNLVVCVSEGIHDREGRFICEYAAESNLDTFGHKMLTGCGKYLEQLLKSSLHVKVRSVELNVPQRCSASMMSETDLKEAVMAGAFGVESLLGHHTGKMVTFERQEGKYQLTCALQPVEQICNREKKVPLEWISASGSDVTKAFASYAKPLIQGTVELSYGPDGLPLFLTR